MNARLKAALLWGVVGTFAFLVLVQGYELWTGRGVDVAVKLLMAIVVGSSSTLITYVTEGRYAPDAASDVASDVPGASDENETS